MRQFYLFIPNINAPEGQYSSEDLIQVRDNGKEKKSQKNTLPALIPTKLTNTGRHLSRHSHPFRSAICFKSPGLLIPRNRIDPSNCPPCVCLCLVPGQISVPGAADVHMPLPNHSLLGDVLYSGHFLLLNQQFELTHTAIHSHSPFVATKKGRLVWYFNFHEILSLI